MTQVTLPMVPVPRPGLVEARRRNSRWRPRSTSCCRAGAGSSGEASRLRVVLGGWKMAAAGRGAGLLVEEQGFAFPLPGPRGSGKRSSAFSPSRRLLDPGHAESVEGPAGGLDLHDAGGFVGAALLKGGKFRRRSPWALGSAAKRSRNCEEAEGNNNGANHDDAFRGRRCLPALAGA